MKTSNRTWLLIGLWVVATIIVAILTNEQDNASIIIGIVSIPLLLAWIVSLFIDNI